MLGSGTRAEIRHRADRVFLGALLLGAMAGITVCIGTGLAFAGLTAVGIASEAAGAMSGIFSGIFAKLYSTENRTLRGLMQDMRRIEECRLGLWLADQLCDDQERDAAIQALIKRLNSVQ